MPLSFKIGDITKLNVDAIVNAANSSLLGGGGVDGAIHRAAGPSLREYNRTLGGCRVSEAKISPGFNLPSKHVISVVSPIYKGGSFNEEALLYNTYQNALKLAVREGLKSIAFPLISAGAYGYPPSEAIEIAIRSISDFLDHNEIDVTLVFFNKASIHHLENEVYEELLKYIDSMLQLEFSEIMKNGQLMPSDIAPAHAIKEYNELYQNSILMFGEDVTIHPKEFIKMRKRAGYDQKTTNKELKEIYLKEELKAYR